MELGSGLYYDEIWANVGGEDVYLGDQTVLARYFDYISLTTLLNAFGVILDVPIMTQDEIVTCAPMSAAMIEAYYNPNTRMNGTAIVAAVNKLRHDWLSGIEKGLSYGDRNNLSSNSLVLRDARYGVQPVEFTYIDGLSFRVTHIPGTSSYTGTLSFDEIMTEIDNGFPIIVQITYPNPANDPNASTDHALLIRGYATISGTDYVIFNDPWGVLLIQEYSTINTQSGVNESGNWHSTYVTRPR